MRLRDAGYMTSAYWLTKAAEKGLKIYADNDTTPAYAEASKDWTSVKFAVKSGDFGVRIAPTGKLEITGSGARDPDWRSRQRVRFGVGLDLASEFAGSLVCPHTQRVIPVSRIEDNPVLWIDREYKKAIVAGGVTYETPDGPPIQTMSNVGYPRTVICYSFANQKRYKDFAARYEPIFNEAKLRKSLMSPAQHGEAWPAFRQWLKPMLIDRPDVTDIEAVVATSRNIQYDSSIRFSLDPEARLRQIVLALSFVDLAQDSWRDWVKEQCADRYESDYLIYKET